MLALERHECQLPSLVGLLVLDPFRTTQEELRMNLKPLGDRVIVLPSDEDEQRTASGLVIPDTAKEKPQTGVVVAVGPGARNDNGDIVPMDVNVDDVVVYSKYGGTEYKFEAQEYLILSARDVIAVFG